MQQPIGTPGQPTYGLPGQTGQTTIGLPQSGLSQLKPFGQGQQVQQSIGTSGQTGLPQTYGQGQPFVQGQQTYGQSVGLSGQQTYGQPVGKKPGKKRTKKTGDADFAHSQSFVPQSQIQQQIPVQTLGQSVQTLGQSQQFAPQLKGIQPQTGLTQQTGLTSQQSVSQYGQGQQFAPTIKATPFDSASHMRKQNELYGIQQPQTSTRGISVPPPSDAFKVTDIFSVDSKYFNDINIKRNEARTISDNTIMSDISQNIQQSLICSDQQKNLMAFGCYLIPVISVRSQNVTNWYASLTYINKELGIDEKFVTSFNTHVSLMNRKPNETQNEDVLDDSQMEALPNVEELETQTVETTEQTQTVETQTLGLSGQPSFPQLGIQQSLSTQQTQTTQKPKTQKLGVIISRPSGKWIKVEYLIQYLMFSSVSFAKKFSILIHNIMVSTMGNPGFSLENINQEIISKRLACPIKVDKIYENDKTEVKQTVQTQPGQTEQQPKVKYIAFSSSKMLIPRLVTSSPNYAQVIEYLKRTNKFVVLQDGQVSLNDTKPLSWTEYVQIFTPINFKDVFHPADYKVYNNIINRKLSYLIQITENKNDKKITGIVSVPKDKDKKDKKDKKDREMIDSQESFDVEYLEIDPSITMGDLTRTLNITKKGVGKIICGSQEELDELYNQIKGLIENKTLVHLSGKKPKSGQPQQPQQVGIQSTLLSQQLSQQLPQFGQPTLLQTGIPGQPIGQPTLPQSGILQSGLPKINETLEPVN